MPASGRETRLAGAPGPAGELPAQQEQAPDRLGAPALGLRIELPAAPQRAEEAVAEPVNETGPRRIGFHREVPKAFQGDLLPGLDWVETKDGALAATLLVSSPQAKSIRVALHTDLPPGGALRFFHPGGNESNVLIDPVVTGEDLRSLQAPSGPPSLADGARPQVPAGIPAASKSRAEAVAAEPAPDSEVLWSPSVQGDLIGIEIRLPSQAARQQASLRLERIAHRFADADTFDHLRGSPRCNGHIDVQCRTDRFRSGLEDAVVRLEYESGGGSSVCSGVLLNDSDATTFVPYIITAWHCLTTRSRARSVQATWFHQLRSCGSQARDGRTATTFGGADLLAQMFGQDASLIRLRRRPPPNVFFSGWDRTTAARNDAVYGIHHPAGVVKKYSAGTITDIRDASIFGSGLSLTDALQVTWSEGTVESGSSGSGLFRNDLLIGTLHGGNRCGSSPDTDYYSSFESMFSQVCPFLDPQSCDSQNARNLATPTAAISATSPPSLTEANLDNATLRVALTNTIFSSGVTKDSFRLTTDVPGLAIDDLVSTVASGDRSATLRLDYGGTDFDTARTLSVTVVAAAHAKTGDLTSATVPVSPGLDLTLSRTTLSLNESPGATSANVGTYTVVLDEAPTAATTVTVASADVAVTIGSTTLTFTPQNWSTPQTVTATAQQDDDLEDESVAVTHRVPGRGNVATVRVRVTDDDRGTVLLDADPATAALDPGPLFLSEASGDANNALDYAVRLSAQPTGSVSVAVASGDTGAVTASPSWLTFTTGNWNAPQTVTATAVADSPDAVDESTTITHTATGGGYGSPVARLRVAVSDDERSGTDYDRDEDGLIEIASLAQLNAVRWDLDGDGTASSGNVSSYSTAFPTASTGMGCPTGGCSGYELTADLDFDTDGDGATHSDGTSDSGDDYHNGGSGWDPIGPASAPSDTTHYNAAFDGNGHRIFNLFVNRARDNSGLFAAFGSGAKVTSLGLADAHVRSGQEAVGTLAGQNRGRISAAWSTGSASGADSVGGLVGIAQASSTIVASYSRASVACTGTGDSGDAGGLAASNAGTVWASYATGELTSTSCSSTNLHGLTSGGAVSASYWDLEASAVTNPGGGLGQTTSALQSPRLATGIYAGWDRLDLDGDGDPSEAPWDFGTSSQYPALRWRGMDPVLQRGDYDADDDGLIEVRDLAQLNAIRWDLDGDGAPSTNSALFRKAFPNHRADMGCPLGPHDLDDNDCTGYELAANLDFDTDGDGATHRNGVGDSGDAYHNEGTGFEPIGDDSGNRFSANFKGNGHSISNLFINRGSRDDTGLFGALEADHRIETLGLPNAYVRGNTGVGALVGTHYGTIAASYSTGRVIAAGRTAGGLVGFMYSRAGLAVVASYSSASVTAGNSGSGGLLGRMLGSGSVSASYAAGEVTGSGGGGLVGCPCFSATTLSNAYWDRTRSGQSNSNGGISKTTAELRGPTSASGIYSAWDDLDVDGDGVRGAAADPDDDVWEFGSSNQYPVLKVANFDTALQTLLQPDVAPSFAASVPTKTYGGGVPIEPFQIPAASGANGATSYTVSGLPAGLKFDTTGTDPDGCTASDFPPGTAASWATAPRTVCGTPTVDGESTVTIRAADSDDRMASTDEATLTFTIRVLTPTASISATDPSPLTEAGLDNATLTLTLANTVFAGGVTRQSFTLTTDVPGLAIDGLVSTVAAGDDSATLRLSYNGMDFDTERTLSVTVAAAAHATTMNLTTATVSVSSVLDLTLSRTTLSLNENPGTTNANVGTYTVVLDEAPAAATTVTVASADVAVTVGSATLTFTPQNWSTPQTVTATAQQDDDAADESVALTHAAAGSGNLATVMVTVADDDTGTVLIDADPASAALDPGPLLLSEASGDANNALGYAVRLSAAPTGNVSVAVASGDTGAVTASPGSLTFTTQNWNAEQTVTATAVDDATALDESVTITHRATGGGYNGTVARLRVAVSDDERANTDYDRDEDGLIEISNLAQLNALRWDLNGDGTASSGNAGSYSNAFPNASTGMGCPTGGCSGYELTADLDFDTDGDGATHSDGASDSGDDYHNGGSGWEPIGPASTPSDTTHYNAAFDGNGHRIFNLFVNRSRDNSGLFAAFGSGARVTSLGLADAHVQSGQNAVGTLAGRNSGRISAAWSTGSASGVEGVGGLVGINQAGSTIVASYSRASVACTGTGASRDAGGLAASNAGTVWASYATGAVTSTSCPSGNLHGLTAGGKVRASYWDRQASGVAASGEGLGQTTSVLRSPRSAAGIYAGWDRLDLDGDGDPSEAPWDFGTSSQYPALRWRGMDPVLQRGDYDADDDGLIEVRDLAQLNAIRWDLDGNGAPSSNSALYRKAFRNHRTDMGCPVGADDSDDNDCTGYELLRDLDFDTDGDGSTHTSGVGDSDDAYYEAGAGFEPIGDDSGNRFSADFKGNGHSISNLFINRGSRSDTGLFGALQAGHRIEGLGLPNAYVRGNNWVGALVGSQYGTIAAAYSTGQVAGAAGSRMTGGLVGFANGAIVAAYSAASVSGGRDIGGLAGRLSGSGSISASYAWGAVSQLATSGGLVGVRLPGGTVSDSYWDRTSSDQTTSAGGVGKTTAELQVPIAYGASGIYSGWDDLDVDDDGAAGVAADADDDAWAFGASYQYPVLKFAGFDTGAQLNAQPDIAPVFGTAAEDKVFRNGTAIEAFQIPAASGGNGAISYSASGLPVGLSFGAGNCATALSICGTPSTDGVFTVTVTATDGDPNTEASDQATLTFMIRVVTLTASISATSPSSLSETNLDNATLTVQLTNTTFASGVTTASFTLTTNVPGLSIDSVATVASGDASATLTLDYDGTDFDRARTLAVTVKAAAHMLPGDLVTGTVAVTPQVGVRVSPPSLSVQEDPTAGGATNANQASYSLVLESQPPGDVTVTATSLDAAVQVDTDTTPLARTLTFTTTTWETAQTVTVAAQQDDDAADESVSVTHAVAGYPGVTAATTLTVAVDDDETAAILIDADPATTNLDESGPLALTEGHATDASKSYTVRLSSEPTQDTTVTITSDEAAVTVGDTDGDAMNGVQNTLTFTSSNWSTGQTVTLTAADDDNGINESATITHRAATATTSEYANLMATLTANTTDDDAPGIVFDADPSTPATDDSGPLALTEDHATDASKSYTVRLSAQPTQTVTATLTSARPAKVAVDDTDGIASGVQNTLVFTATTWNTAQTVGLTAQGDDDGADESVTITHAASTATSSEYTGVSADFTASVTDDETPAIVLSASTLSVPEESSATYTARLATQPAGGDVTVTITGAANGLTADTSASSGIQTTLVFTASNWATERTVRVSAANDNDGSSESATLTHAASTASTSEYTNVTASLVANSVDNDAPSLNVSPTQLTVEENGSAAYAIRLNTLPSAAVTVTVAGFSGAVTVDTDGIANGNQSTLIFTQSNWSAAQSVTVSAADDDNGTDEMLTLTHAAAGGDYNSLAGSARPSVNLRVDDDDTNAILLDADPSTDSIDESGPLALKELQSSPDNSKSYTVRLGTEPSANVTVTIASDEAAVTVGDTDGDSTNGVQNTLIFTASTWSTRRTVTLTAADDPNGISESATITHQGSGATEYASLMATLTANAEDDDAPGFIFDADPATPATDDSGPLALTEDHATDASKSYTVRLTAQPTQTLTVTITSAKPAKVRVDDTDSVAPSVQNSLIFTALNWSTAQTVTLTAQGDDDGADESSVAITHAAATATSSEYQGVSADFTASVTDDETPAITLSASALSVNEQNSAEYTVRLATEPVGGSVTVTITGAADGVSVNRTSLRFNASNWSTAQTVTVRAADDQNGNNEQVTLSHSASGADYGGATAAEIVVTAQDDDQPGLQVGPSELRMREGETATYRVRLNTLPGGAVTVTVGGTTAEVWVDVDGDPGNGGQNELEFDASNWSAWRTVEVHAAEDDNGADETATLTHAAAGGGGDYDGLALTARPGVSVWVEDDDEPEILIDADPSTASVDEPGPLALNEDAMHADNAKDYTVRLATEPTGPVAVTASSGDRAVHVDTDTTPLTRTLSFTTSNWATPQTVTATAAQDDDTLNEDGTAPPNEPRVAIVHAATGGDYDGLMAQLTAETTDDDEPALVLEVSALTAFGVAEGGATAYSVRLATEPAETVTASVSVVGGVSVDMDGDQADLQRSARFDMTNWSAPRMVAVRGLQDHDAASGTATLRHSASGADYGRAPAVEVSFAVADDDAPAVLVGAASLAVNEGLSAAYEVRLATAPVGGPVRVALSSSNAGAATVSPAALTFTASNWDAPQRVTVRGTVDDGDSSDGAAMIMHSASGGDYGGAPAPMVSVTVRDDEAAGVRIEPPQLRVREGASAGYRVRLNTAPSGDVTVTATSADAALEVDAGDAAPLRRVLRFTTEDWSLGQRVSASAGRDDDAADASLTVSHAVTGYAGVSAAPALTVLVEDADAPGFVFDPPGGLSLSEEPADPADAAGSYLVRLATQPSGTVAVEVSSDDAGVEVDADATPRTLSLSFDASNWSSARTVAVRAVADGDGLSESASLLHSASGGGYGGVFGTLRVRVLDDDAPPAPPPPPPAPPENRPPSVLGSLPDLDLEVGESASVHLGGLFADEDPLTHWAESSDASVASARVERGLAMEVRGLSPGTATVTVWASDTGGLRASLSFGVSVGRVLSFASASASAPEGGTVRLPLMLSRPAEGALAVSWTALPDGDPGTADADAADLGALRGTAEFAPGGTEALIEVEVHDDPDIEPSREYLRLELGAPPAGADWALGRSWALLEIEEGVCDRTPAVRDALRGTRPCQAPAPAELSRRGYLGLHRTGIDALRPKDLLGLSGLRVLHLHGNRLAALPEGLLSGLDALERLRLEGNRLAGLPADLLWGTPALESLDLGGNRLESLPAGLFAGVSKLSELNLEGNPGAPFPLAVRLVRTDADPWAPGPARVEARVAEGAPFALSALLAAEGAEPSAASVFVPAGALAGAPFQAASTGPGAARLFLSAAPAVPPDLCGDVQDGRHPCFRGLAPQAGPPLLLFKPAPGVTDEPPAPALSANGDRASIPLAELFSPSGEGDRLSYAAESDRPDLVAARIVGEALVLDANEDGAEGTAVVTVTATDADGPSASLSFTVEVEFAPVGALPGWRIFMRGAGPSRSPAEGSFMRGTSPSRSPAEGSG